MTQYRITSRASVDHGVWSGVTPTHALYQMHRDAGYTCGYSAVTDEILWPSASEKKVCGDVNDWLITLV
jgi:hypothetical protein